jgi:hypothetical protein
LNYRHNSTQRCHLVPPNSGSSYQIGYQNGSKLFKKRSRACCGKWQSERSQSSRVLSAIGAIRAMTPALLNAASRRPNSATVRRGHLGVVAHITTDRERRN